MQIRNFDCAGVACRIPPYVHRHAFSGWRINLLGFTRIWDDDFYGGPQQSARQAIELLCKILEGDKKTLLGLFNAHVNFPAQPDGAIKALITDRHKKLKEIPLGRYMKIPEHLAGVSLPINEALLLIGKSNYEAVYESWCKELRHATSQAHLVDVRSLLKDTPAAPARPLQEALFDEG